MIERGRDRERLSDKFGSCTRVYVCACVQVQFCGARVDERCRSEWREISEARVCKCIKIMGSFTESPEESASKPAGKCACQSRCRSGGESWKAFAGLFAMSLALHFVTLACYVELRSEVEREIRIQKSGSGVEAPPVPVRAGGEGEVHEQVRFRTTDKTPPQPLMYCSVKARELSVLVTLKTYFFQCVCVCVSWFYVVSCWPFHSVFVSNLLLSGHCHCALGVRASSGQ